MVYSCALIKIALVPPFFFSEDVNRISHNQLRPFLPGHLRVCSEMLPIRGEQLRPQTHTAANLPYRTGQKN
jgi:hypothetical protein